MYLLNVRRSSQLGDDLPLTRDTFAAVVEEVVA
jgi:hypothetical protein